MTDTTNDVGEVREVCLVEGLTRTQIVQYAGASGDFNPLHTDEVFVVDATGGPGVFAHGMLTMGMTGRVLTDWFGAENIVSYSARFVAQVWPGDVLTARAVVEGVAGSEGQRELNVSLSTTNQHGRPVLTGTAVVRRPRQVSASGRSGWEHDA